MQKGDDLHGLDGRIKVGTATACVVLVTAEETVVQRASGARFSVRRTVNRPIRPGTSRA